MTKKWFLTMFSMILVLSFVLTGCGGSKQQTSEKPADTSSNSTPKGSDSPKKDNGDTIQINLATAPEGGAYYVVGQALAQLINKYSDKVNIKAQTTEGSAHNIRLFQSDQAQMGIVSADAISDVINGKNAFDGKPWNGFSAIVSGHVGEWQIGVPADSDIKTVSDLKGKVVAWRLQGSTTVDQLGGSVFEAYGLDPEKDMKTQISSPYPDAAQRMKDGRTDAVGTLVGYPAPWITEYVASSPIRILSLDQDKIDSILKKYPFFVQSKVPAGTYKGVDYDVNTVANITMLMISNKIPEDVVYEITKILFEHGDEAKSVAKQVGPYVSKDNALKVQGVADYNPGAVKYYKEIGIWKQ